MAVKNGHRWSGICPPDRMSNGLSCVKFHIDNSDPI